MSENANHFQFYGRNVTSKTEDVENLGRLGWTKDNYAQLPQTSRMMERAGRMVLGSLTNKPQEVATLPLKQQHMTSCNTVEDELRRSHPSTAPTHSQLATSCHNAIDLSCAEMDSSLDCDRQHDSVMDVHDSPILLDISRSSCEDTSLDECNVEDDDDFKDRVDKLLSMAEYRDEIYHYLRKAELIHRPKPNYMQRQSDITSNMRSILVDWLVEVADEYKLHRETLFLAVDYVDRFLSVMAVQRQKLQLVGAAAMFIAAKYEEIYPPDVGEFVYITDDTYTKQQVLRMESLVLKVLSFDVAVPTANLFVERFLKEMKADVRTISMALYLTELSLIDGDVFLHYLPSVVACAAVCLARYSLGEQDPWPHAFEDMTQYKMSDFDGCMRDLLVAFTAAPKHAQQAIQEKYKHSKYHEVSTLLPPPCLPRPSF